MPARPYHHGSLEAALVDVALDVVESEGIEAVVLRDLARTIGVSASACYRHFPSREHLVARVAQIGREHLAEALIAARGTVPSAGPLKQRAFRHLGAIGHAYVRFAIDNPNLFVAAFAQCDVAPERPDDPSAWGVLDDTVAELVSTGAIPRSRRHDAPLIAWSGVHGLAQILTSSIWPPGLDVGTKVDAVIDGILRAVR